MYLVLNEHPNLIIKILKKEHLDNLDSINVFELDNFQDVYDKNDIDMDKFVNVWK